MGIFKAFESVFELMFIPTIKTPDVHSIQMEELLELQHSIQQQLFNLEEAIHPNEFNEVND